MKIKCIVASICALSALLQPINIRPAQALETINSDVASLNGKVLHKEVELLRLNSEFRTHYMAHVKNQQRRLKFFDTIGGGNATAGDVTLISAFSRYHQKPGLGLQHRGQLESGAITVLVAYLTLGTLYAGEGLYDLFTDYKSIQQHWDAHSVVKRALDLRGEIDDLLASRKRAVGDLSGLSTKQSNILLAEENVLRDMRDLSFLEFSRLYLDSRKRLTTRNLTTLGTMAVCATGAFPGAYGVIQGLKRTDLKTVGAGGIGFLVSSGTLTAAPVIIHGGALVAGKLTPAQLGEKICTAQVVTIDNLERDTTALGTLLKGSEEPLFSDNNISEYTELLAFMKDRSNFLDRDRRHQKRDIIESFISYGARGGPQIAFGTQLARAGYHFTNNPVKALGTIENGAIVNQVAWGLWLGDTFQKQLRNEITNHLDAKVCEPFCPTSPRLAELEAISRTVVK